MVNSGFLTRDGYERRMARAGRAAVDAGLAGLIVTPGPDLVWLCGYQPTAVTERLTALVIEPGRAGRLLVPVLERPDAERAAGAGALEVVGWTDGADPYAELGKWLAPQGRYGVSDGMWALHLLGLQRSAPAGGYAALTEALPMLRAVKDAYEVERLAAAGAAADATYQDILGVPFAGRRECDIAADLARLLTEHGHSQVDFTVVGSGPNGANPHHEAGERVIQDGDMVVLDFVREAQQAAFEAVRPGVACQEIDRVARRVIKAAGYGEYFIHRTGHGIGVTTHEPPYMVEGEHLPLVPGMCFSIEPGIYLPGRFGVRIEDIVVCTEAGGRRLNVTGRGMAEVG